MLGGAWLFTLSSAAYAPRPTQASTANMRQAKFLYYPAVTASAVASSDYLLQKLDAGRGSFLLHTWAMAAQTERANGFSPASEAIGDGALRMKYLADELPKLVSTAKILGLCEKGTLSFDNLEEPHASMAERLSRTSLQGAVSAGKGSAVAFVSRWEDHVSIDRCVVNPRFLTLGEEAEAALLQHIVETAVSAGLDEVKLRPGYQVNGSQFYESCGFFASDAEGDEWLYHRTVE